MADIIRSAKSGSKWNAYDLIAYNITVTAQPPEQFFRGNPSPPSTGVDPSLIDSAVDDKNVSDATFEYLGYLAIKGTPNKESSVNHFALETLRALGFVERGSAITSPYNIPLRICDDDRRVAQTDVCLLDRRLMILLVLQKEKLVHFPTDPDLPGLDDPDSQFLDDPEPQVIAQAIAAFNYNNQKRHNSGLPALDVMTIPCITLIGTRPIFYLVPVTEALSLAVSTGQYPEVPTKVVKCVTLLGHNRQFSESMETPEYRRVAFQRFVAFKDLAEECWQTFIV